MAQASILLFSVLKPDIAAKKMDYFLGKVEVRFLKPVRPGDCLILEVTRNKILAYAGMVKAAARVGDETAAEGELMFGVKKNEA
jgi:3-hydroxyacyl-[acyl-carrier-protein] dehydratase